MDIEYESTPPKRTRREFEFSTPNHKTTPKDTQTPKKSRVSFESPERICKVDMMSTPPKRHENPESKKVTKNSSNSPPTPYKSPVRELFDDNEVSAFWLPRIESDYKYVRTLGNGNFSRVELYESRLTQELFAIKTTSMSLMSVNEVQALGTLSMFSQRSKHIVKYYCSWIEEGKIYIAMEYCENSLKDIFSSYKNSNTIIEEDKLKEMLRQALVGLKCMHEQNMVHLDIKPDNLLIKDGDVKVADLGLCRITRIKRWTDLDQGDSRYLAKEVLNYHQGIDLTKSDIYSLGMSIFEGAILQALPNNGEDWLRIRQDGINLKEVPQLSHYSEEFKQILAKMLQVNWQDRPSCEELLNYTYFAQQKNKRLSRFMRASGKSSRKMEGSL